MTSSYKLIADFHSDLIQSIVIKPLLVPKNAPDFYGSANRHNIEAYVSYQFPWK